MRILAIVALIFAGPFLSAQDDICKEQSAARRRVVDRHGKLAPVISAADIVVLTVCGDDDVVNLFNAGLKNRSYQPVSFIAIVAAMRKVAYRVPESVCPDVSRCDAYVAVSSLPDDLQDKTAAAGSGGLPDIPQHAVLSFFARHAGSLLAGHFEITQSAVDQYGSKFSQPMSANARATLADASRDPDFFEWLHPEAHAQTANGGDGRILPGDAREAFRKWEIAQIRSIAGACSNHDLTAAVYWTGYAMHGFQDLAFHAGMTNAEHAFHDYGSPVDPERGVDIQFEYPKKRALAVDGTIRFLAGLQRKLPASCWSAITSYRGSKPSNRAKVALHHNRHTDISLLELRQYQQLATVVSDALSAGVPRAALFVEPRWIDPVATDAVRILDATIDDVVERSFTANAP